MKIDLTAREEALAVHLLGLAELPMAAQLGNLHSDTINDALNSANIPVATSLMGRVLIARAVMNVAAAWLADCYKGEVTVEEAQKALLSIMLNPPALLAGEVYLDPSIDREVRAN